MARTSQGAVQAILLDDYDSVNSPSLQPFIDTANVIVSRVATCATAKGKTLSSTELELIERWLAAHGYAMVDQPYQSKTTQQASATFQGRTGMGLEATKYGQQALSVDYSGCLKAIASGNRKTAGLTWGGKAESEQLDYDERN